MLEPDIHRLLVLDDDAFAEALLVRMLENQGFTQVAACDNGLSALARVDDPLHRPDLILCDLNMPEMDGLEFVRQLADRSYPGSLILVTGEEARILKTAEQLVKAHGIPVLGCLQKPYGRDQLAQVLASWRPPGGTPGRPERKAYGAQALAEAISRGELVNFYQPKVDVASGRVAGVETLVRWHHPQDGLVYPDAFIGVAETHHLIDALTQVVLVQAFAQAVAWRDAGLELRVAVNVSMDNLASLDFADFVARAARESGVDPRTVILEVTESRLMGDLRAPLEVLTRLRLKGFHLSIDDFGTGHSSFTQLQAIPFNELKIDRSFVHGAWLEPTARAIFEASLGLASRLGMEAVAEGVEDLQDWTFLQGTGCDLAQGYFIARPMPAQDLPAWIARWREASLATPALEA